MKVWTTVDIGASGIDKKGIFCHYVGTKNFYGLSLNLCQQELYLES